MKFRISYWYGLAGLLICQYAGAQNRPDIQKIYPTYTEDFHNYRSYPSICIDDVWQDAVGRLWLKTCLYASEDRLHLYLFDGYDFQLVSHVLDSLPSGAAVEDRLKDNIFIGRLITGNREQLYLINLDREDIAYFDIPATSWIRAMVPMSGDSIRLLSARVGAWTVLTWQNGKFTSKDIPLPVDFTPEQPAYPNLPCYLFNGYRIWYSDRDKALVRVADVETKVSKAYRIAGINDADWVNEHIYPYAVREINGETLLILRMGSKTRVKLLWLDQSSGQFVDYPALDHIVKDVGVFADKRGNQLMVAQELSGEMKAILTDHDGQLFDYSPLFGQDLNTKLVKVISDDFKRSLIICSTNGLKLQKVSVSGGIVNYLKDESLRAMVELPDHRILVTTQNDHHFLLNSETGQITPAHFSCGIMVRNIVHDTKGDIWVCEWNTLQKLDPVTGACTPVTSVNSSQIMLYTISADEKSFYMLDFEGGLWIYDTRSGVTRQYTEHSQPLLVKGRLHAMLADHLGHIWVAASTGLWKIDVQNESHQVLGHTLPFQDSRILCISEDVQGKLWLGSAVGGVQIYDPKSGEVQVLNTENGLANNTVVSIQPDNDGVRWVATYNGVSLVSPQGDLIANLYPQDGLIHRENNRYSSLKASNGKILIGTVQGLNVIDPEQVKSRLYESDSLRIYLTAVERPTPKGTMQKTTWFRDIDTMGKLILPAANRSLNLQFALSNFFKPEDHQYAYKFAVRDTAWTNIGNRNTLRFNDLNPGDYTLLIKGSDAVGNETVNAISLDIESKAFFYQRVWFWILCVLAFSALGLLWIVRLRTEVNNATSKIRKDKELIETQAEQLKELDAAKSRFFTNISHEFRTPLTVISGMAAQIHENPQLWAEKGSQMIRENSRSLLGLVNQILDLRKLESAKMHLEPVQADLVAYTRYLTESFQQYAASKGKGLHFVTAVPEVIMDFDPGKIMQIVSNLVSNAIKYTRESDQIYVHLDARVMNGPEQVILRVEDTGPGIETNKLPLIFDRFYQVDDSLTREAEGTGVGLALTRELVRLMHGDIKVESTKGKGTVFTITIPITRQAPLQQAGFLIRPIEAAIKPESISSIENPDEESDGLPRVLIVEDHQDLAALLASTLSGKYALSFATNGQEGIDQAIESIPDLVISDVMMPRKDGFELCTTLKQDIRTDHIPIILLTAKADAESRISGLQYGADAYMTKPFEPKELLVQLENLLELRKKLQARYAQGLPGKDSETKPNTQDLFLQKLREVVSAHIEDDTFGVVQLCRAMSLSRTQLHHKIKAVTGKSTTIFIRHLRLLKARDLLMNTEMNVSEVAYAVGFHDPKYFSRSYIEEFGEPPSRTHN